MGDNSSSAPPEAKIDWDFIWEQEGGVLKKSYIPKKTSGVTIGPGFDIGQHTVGEIKKLKLSPSLEDKLIKFAAHGPGNPRTANNDSQLGTDYDAIQNALAEVRVYQKQLKEASKALKTSKVELNKAEKDLKKLTAAKKETSGAEDKVLVAAKKVADHETQLEQSKEKLSQASQALKDAKTKNSFTFELTQEEVSELTQAVIEDKQPKFIATYNEAVREKEAAAKAAGKELKLKRFEELPESVQTAIASFQFNRGEKRGITGTQAEKDFWNAAVEQKDWNEVAKLLKATDLGKDYLKHRREAEANYLINHLPKEEKEQSFNELNPNRLRVAENDKFKIHQDSHSLTNEIKDSFGLRPSSNQAKELAYWKEQFGSEKEENNNFEEKSPSIGV